MAAVPTDIATTQAEALGAAEPEAAPRKGRKPTKEAANSDASPETTQEVAEAVTQAAPATTGPSASSTTGGDAAKKNRVPWFVDRAERNLRNRASQSFPIMTKTLSLQTYHAQDILARTERNWSEAMITLSETMRNFKPEDQCVEVDAAVDRLLDECIGSIQSNVERLNKIAEAHGLDMDEVEAEYSKPSTHKLKVLSPREFRYHKLLQDLDKMCCLTDKLWFLTLISDRHRSQIPYEIKRQIIRMVNRVRTLVYRAQASAQRAGAPDAADPRVGTILDPNAAKLAAPADSEASDAPATQAGDAPSAENRMLQEPAAAEAA